MRGSIYYYITKENQLQQIGRVQTKALLIRITWEQNAFVLAKK